MYLKLTGHPDQFNKLGFSVLLILIHYTPYISNKILLIGVKVFKHHSSNNEIE